MSKAIDTAQHIIDTISQSDDSNVRRATKAFLTIYPDYDNDTLSQGLSDLLCDIRHLCDLAGFNYYGLDQGGHKTYQAELQDCGIAEHAEFKTAIHEELE